MSKYQYDDIEKEVTFIVISGKELLTIIMNTAGSAL